MLEGLSTLDDSRPMRHVILCDEQGNPKGTTSIEDAHRTPGQLHKAFSVVLFDEQRKQTLIQLWAQDKLFGGLWSNTCCSHPKEEENIIEAGQRRIKEECGFPCPPLRKLFSFTYKAEDPNGKGIEWEYDTILVGNAIKEAPFKPNPKEVESLKWTDVAQLMDNIQLAPELYTPWFVQAIKHILATKND